MEQEHDLIRQIILGNIELFEQVVLEYQNLIFTICLNIVDNRGDAENLAQETFLAAYCSLTGFHGGSFKAWICRIAANKSIDFKRKQSKYVLEEIGQREQKLCDGRTVDELLEEKERNAQLQAILSALPDKYASVIRAFYYEELTAKEIAQELELPLRTVETRLLRAKKLIKERWDGDAG